MSLSTNLGAGNVKGQPATPAPLVTRGQVLGMPTQNANNQQTQTQSWCRFDPLVCLQQAAIESVFLAISYVAILFLTDSPVPGFLATLKFVLLFAFVSFASRQVSDSLGDKIAIGAMGGLGGKLVALMVPKYVGW